MCACRIAPTANLWTHIKTQQIGGVSVKSERWRWITSSYRCGYAWLWRWLVQKRCLRSCRLWIGWVSRARRRGSVPNRRILRISLLVKRGKCWMRRGNAGRNLGDFYVEKDKNKICRGVLTLINYYPRFEYQIIVL